MKIYENQWKSKKIHGNLSKTTRDLLTNYDNHKNQCKSMKINGNQKEYMEIY